MVETQLFYWTGVTLWSLLCLSVVLMFALFAIWLPCYLIIWARKSIWHWVWAAKIAKYGFTQEEIQRAYLGTSIRLPDGVTVADMVNWVGLVKERAEKIGVHCQKTEGIK